MTFSTMLVAMVFIGVMGTVLILQQIRNLRQTGVSDASQQKLEQQVHALEERVRTLERIATDKQQTLKDEIDTL